MDYLITGCERSGTTFTAKYVDEQYENIDVYLEPKWTVASYKLYKELMRWRSTREHAENSFEYLDRYISSMRYGEVNNTVLEKHTLNTEQNILFLTFLMSMYPEVKVLYILRDGREVVESIVEKQWGHSEYKNYKKNYDQAIEQWNRVIETTYEMAITQGFTIVKYEQLGSFDFGEFFQLAPREPIEFKHSQYPNHTGVQQFMKPNLIRTGYIAANE